MLCEEIRADSTIETRKPQCRDNHVLSLCSLRVSAVHLPRIAVVVVDLLFHPP